MIDNYPDLNNEEDLTWDRLDQQSYDEEQEWLDEAYGPYGIPITGCEPWAND